MRIVHDRINVLVPLYRGEDLSKRHELERVGVCGRVHHIDQLQLFVLDPELQAHLAIGMIERHVLNGSAHSPFKSWSGRSDIGAYFATGGGAKPGVLLSTRLQLVERYRWETADGWSQAFRDISGRTLIPTGSLSTNTEHTLTRPAEASAIRQLGTADVEFLVLGRIHPHEMTMQVLRARHNPAHHPAGQPAMF